MAETISEKLRKRTVRVQDHGASWEEPDTLCIEAANYIEKLEQELAEWQSPLSRTFKTLGSI